ncbi:MAG: alpha-glucuronidase [Prevotella sp.]|nr:alpha-glucuronidase [Prevotella sp.]
MKKLLLSVLVIVTVSFAKAEDGHRLWLRYNPVHTALVEAPAGSPTISIAQGELEKYYQGSHVILRLDPSMPDNEGFVMNGNDDQLTITARHDIGLLYGAYEALRLQATDMPVKDEKQEPKFKLRLLNHWDNLDGSIERGYAGESIFEWFKLDEQLIRDYARANASIGINGSVLNNVNASPKMLTKPYLKEVKKIADILRPYGIRVFLSINFATPMALGQTTTADPKDASVRKWWKGKAKEIYKLIPDFGGFLVKANSEGQPGPGDYHRTHADGANMLAEALEPYQGIVMWRCFVYGANHKGEDRVKQAVSEFKPLDGKFHKNVILQTKNGPLDFQPREAYSPVFDQISKTPNMVELQITQEYLGQSLHLVYLAPMWKEFFQYVEPSWLAGIAGVANIGKDTNWCGHHFSQANWYAFGRLAWDPSLSSEKIAREWLEQTFSIDENFVFLMSTVMEESRETCVNYMMPLGLHHIFKFDHHYGPEPDGFKAEYPLEWCPVYYHKADKNGIGFDRSSTGTDAVSQYREPYASMYDKVETCPENLLLWFHHVPWNYKMKDGSTLWESLQYHYNQGVIMTETYENLWHNKMRAYVDEQRWREVDERLQIQVKNAKEWRDVCLGYFGQFAKDSTSRTP